MYRGAAEYWFYVGLEEGPNAHYYGILTQFETPAFKESLDMYIWGSMFYFTDKKFFDIEAKVFRKVTDEYIVGGNNAKNTKRIHKRKTRSSRGTR